MNITVTATINGGTSALCLTAGKSKHPYSMAIHIGASCLQMPSRAGIRPNAMTHNNRGRVTVDPSGNWQLYTNTIPANSTPLGTVTRDGGETGALVRIETTGAYVQVNAGTVRSLDGRKIAAALGIAGRPPEMHGGKRVNVYLDSASLITAAAIGSGNVSEGIRLALAGQKLSGSK